MMEREHVEKNLRDGKTAKIVLDRAGELKAIWERHPELAARVDGFEEQLVERLSRLREKVDGFPEAERILVAALVRHGIDRMTDEVFLPQES